MSQRTSSLAVLATLVVGIAAVGPPASGSDADVSAACRLQPRVLDAQRPAGPLIVRIELRGAEGSALDPARVEPGVHVSSVRGVPLPSPAEPLEGIDENPVARGLDRSGGVPPSLIARFDRPADGNGSSRDDGDAGDVLAMLLDVPDGREAEVCLSGRIDGTPFFCCDSVTVRNRGQRRLPAVLDARRAP